MTSKKRLKKLEYQFDVEVLIDRDAAVARITKAGITDASVTGSSRRMPGDRFDHVVAHDVAVARALKKAAKELLRKHKHQLTVESVKPAPVEGVQEAIDYVREYYDAELKGEFVRAEQAKHELEKVREEAAAPLIEELVAKSNELQQQTDNSIAAKKAQARAEREALGPVETDPQEWWRVANKDLAEEVTGVPITDVASAISYINDNYNKNPNA